MQHVTLNGDPDRRYAGNLNFSFAYVEGESLLMALKNIAVSSGSACTSASLEPSYVLRAIGADDEMAHSSIRFGIGRFTTEVSGQWSVVSNALVDVTSPFLLLPRSSLTAVLAHSPTLFCRRSHVRTHLPPSLPSPPLPRSPRPCRRRSILRWTYWRSMWGGCARCRRCGRWCRRASTSSPSSGHRMPRTTTTKSGGPPRPHGPCGAIGRRVLGLRGVVLREKHVVAARP